jgi:hypothetical protein
MRFIFVVLIASLFGGLAAAAPVLNGVAIDPGGRVRGELLVRALERWQAAPSARRDRLVVVDFAKTSREPRFYVVDLKTGGVDAYLTAHGKGSDPGHTGRAETFNDTPSGLASSLGAYLTTKRYHGAHGLSLALVGLDPSNANAEKRLIVLHSADYMSAAFRARHGKPGRSFGCFVVEPHLIEALVPQLEGGVLIYAGR